MSDVRAPGWKPGRRFARCLLWYADVQYIAEKDRLRWFLWPADLDAARRFLPFPIARDQSFAEAYYACRLEEDKTRTDDLGRESILAGSGYRQEYRCRRQDGEVRWIAEEVQIQAIAERRWRAVGVCTDITAIKEREAEIQALNARLSRAMAQTHHRVKNNLQVIAALVDLVATDGSCPAAPDEVKRLGRHVRSLATIHELLTQEAKTGGAADRVSVRATMLKLLPLLQEAVGGRGLRYVVEDIHLPVRKVTSLAVLVNELVSNAVKHGRGEVELRLSANAGAACLEVLDDGPGFPTGFVPSASGRTGLELVESLSRWDLQGEVGYDNRPGGGARVTVRFPLSGR